MKYLLPLCILILLGCNPNNSARELALQESGNYKSLAAPPVRDAHAESAETDRQLMTKKVIKTGNLSYQVADVDDTYQNVTASLKSYNAYIENENQSTYGDRSQYSLTIRVPSSLFDSLFSELAGQAEIVENRSIHTEDVTERYYDLETRLKNKKTLEKRYLELLEKASSIEETIKIEQSLNDLRSEIEMLQGQFDYVSKQVSYSTIHLSFYEILPYQYQPESRPGIMERIKIALGGGWQLFVSFLFGVVRLWPFLILLILSIIGVRRYRKR